MSLRNITGRDTDFLYQELERIEQRWALEKAGAFNDSPEYRRDKVLADIISLKIDVITLAQSFQGYEDIKEYHYEILELFRNELDRHIIMQRQIANMIGKLEAQEKKIQALMKVAPETAGDADDISAKGESAMAPV